MIPVLALVGFLGVPAACRFERHAGPPPTDLCTAWAKHTRFEPGIAPESTDCTFAGALVGLSRLEVVAPGLVALEVETGSASGDQSEGTLTLRDGRGLGVLALEPNGPRWLGAAQLLDARRTAPIEGEGPETTTRREARAALDPAARTLALTSVEGDPLGPTAPRPLAQTKHRCPLQLPLPGRFD